MRLPDWPRSLARSRDGVSRLSEHLIVASGEALAARVAPAVSFSQSVTGPTTLERVLELGEPRLHLLELRGGQ